MASPRMWRLLTLRDRTPRERRAWRGPHTVAPAVVASSAPALADEPAAAAAAPAPAFDLGIRRLVHGLRQRFAGAGKGSQ